MPIFRFTFFGKTVITIIRSLTVGLKPSVSEQSHQKPYTYETIFLLFIYRSLF